MERKKIIALNQFIDEKTNKNLKIVYKLLYDAFGENCWSFNTYEEVMEKSYFLFNEMGVIIYRKTVNDIEILSLAVKKKFQSKGVGSNIMHKFFHLIKKNNVRNVFLEVAVNNDKAIKIYKNFGFKVLEKRKNYYYKNEKLIDGISMLKEL